MRSFSVYSVPGTVKRNVLCAGQTSSFIPLTRIKTLVSMTTPRDLHVTNNSILPPFVEFDMAPEGFGCLYLPSLAPFSPSASTASSAATAVVSAAASAASGVGGAVGSSDGTPVVGGIGSGDRAFPPGHPGLTFATWICVDKFSDPRTDPHPVRLLTLVRHVKSPSTPSAGKGSKDEEDRLANNFVCLSVCLSARDKALIVSSQESKEYLLLQ